LDEIEQAFPDARRREIPDQRHLAQGLAPKAFAAVVMSFIAEMAREDRRKK
jgi:hypothetical protein